MSQKEYDTETFLLSAGFAREEILADEGLAPGG